MGGHDEVEFLKPCEFIMIMPIKIYIFKMYNIMFVFSRENAVWNHKQWQTDAASSGAGSVGD